MRKIFQRHLPEQHKLRENRMFAVLGETLLAPRLWCINRRSAASGVAIGLFCGLIPGPLQMLVAALTCLLIGVLCRPHARANLPIALVTTFYTNPLTIVPLYLLAFTIGGFVTGADTAFVMPPEKGDHTLLQWCEALLHWLYGLGTPLALGLLLLAAVLAVFGYFAVNVSWRLHIRHVLRKRRERQLAVVR